MTNAIAGHAVALHIGNGSTAETFSAIAEVLDISGPNQTVEQIEVTSHSSAGWREFIAGLRDGGEISFPVNFIPGDTTQWGTGNDSLMDLFNTGTTWNYRIVFPNGYYGEFAALITAFGVSAPVDGAVTADMAMKISGAVTWDQTT